MVVRRTRSVRSWLRGIDSGDYRRRRVPLHCFNCSALRLENGRPGTCEPHPSPPRQVNSRDPVPVHHHSTLAAPELTSQSLVRLESLPASRTGHTGTSGLTPRQTNNRQAYPSRLVLDLSLSLSETPPVHPATILSTLTITLTIEGSDVLDVLKNYCCSPLDCEGDDGLCCVMEQMVSPGGSASPILRRYSRSYPIIVSSERSYDACRSAGYSHRLRQIIAISLIIVSKC